MSLSLHSGTAAVDAEEMPYFIYLIIYQRIYMPGNGLGVRPDILHH